MSSSYDSGHFYYGGRKGERVIDSGVEYYECIHFESFFFIPNTVYRLSYSISCCLLVLLHMSLIPYM